MGSVSLMDLFQSMYRRSQNQEEFMNDLVVN